MYHNSNHFLPRTSRISAALAVLSAAPSPHPTTSMMEVIPATRWITALSTAIAPLCAAMIMAVE
jgi:hypothetical protein